MSTKEGLLKDLTAKELRQLAKENRIKLVRDSLLWGTESVSRKEDIIELLLESPRITRRKILDIMEPKLRPKPKREQKPKKVRKERIGRKVSEGRISVRGLLNKITKFEPPTRPKREKQLENMLVSYLQAFYNVRTQLTYERARIDATVGSTGIEIKYQPSAGDFDRLYGQIEKYLKHLDEVVVVIGSEKSKELTTSFKKRLKERGWLNKKAFITTL